jgi:hypothetical protein
MEEPSEIDACSYFNGPKTKYCFLNRSLREFPPPSDLKEVWQRWKVFALNNSRTEISYCRDNYLHSTENHVLGVG